MTDQINTVTYAVVGATYDIKDTWHCTCGETHKFSSYMAGHWDFEMLHTCKCGIVREFICGEVVDVKEATKDV